jgi:hypothetical protein
MKPAKVRRHLETKHCDVKNKPTEFFQRCLGTLNYGKDIVLAMGSINSKALEASYLLNSRTAKTGKHSIGKNLLLPAVKDVVKTMFGNKLLKYIDLIPISNDSVGRTLHDMAGNVESQLIEKVKKSPYYALQIDETTDVTNYANLMCYVTYAYDSNIHDDILFVELCQPKQVKKYFSLSIVT